MKKKRRLHKIAIWFDDSDHISFKGKDIISFKAKNIHDSLFIDESEIYESQKAGEIQIAVHPRADVQFRNPEGRRGRMLKFSRIMSRADIMTLELEWNDGTTSIIDPPRNWDNSENAYQKSEIDEEGYLNILISKYKQQSGKK